MSWYKKLLDTAKDVAPPATVGQLWQQIKSLSLQQELPY